MGLCSPCGLCADAREEAAIRRLGPFLALVMLAAANCSIPQGFEITTPMVAPGEAAPTVILSGAAVEDGILCPEATVKTIRWETRSGEPVTDGEAQRLTDEARATGAIMFDAWYDECTCVDGSQPAGPTGHR